MLVISAEDQRAVPAVPQITAAEGVPQNLIMKSNASYAWVIFHNDFHFIHSSIALFCGTHSAVEIRETAGPARRISTEMTCKLKTKKKLESVSVNGPIENLGWNQQLGLPFEVKSNIIIKTDLFHTASTFWCHPC